MSSLNKVMIIGHLGRDPESRSFQNGGKVVNLRVATSETWKDRSSGERKERAEWHSVSILNDGLAGIAEEYLRKGSKVFIEGQLRTRKWQDQSGADRYSTEIVLGAYGGSIVLLDGKDRDGGGSGGTPRDEGGWQGGERPPAGGGAPAAFDHDLDDDVPF